MEPTTIPEIQATLDQERAELKRVWEAYPVKTLTDGSKAHDIPANDLEEINKRNARINELAGKLDSMQTAESHIKAYDDSKKPANRLGAGGNRAEKSKRLSEIVMATDQWNSKTDRGFSMIGADYDILGRKAVMTTATGYEVQNIRDGDFVAAASVLRPTVLDIVRTQPTSSESITYVSQSARTSAAAAKKEGQALAQSSWNVETVTDPLRVIGHYIDVTMQQLEDVDEAQNLIDFELPMMVMEAAETQYLVGAGTGNELTGVYNSANAQTQAKGVDTIIDAVRKTIAKVNDYSQDQRASLVVLRPEDWMEIELQKTADGAYIFANPASLTIPRIWGYRVVESQNLASTTGLVFDDRYFPFVYRRTMQIDTTDSDGEKFQNLIICMRAFIRAGIKHRRGYAACKLTGI